MKDRIRDKALELGFDLTGFAPATVAPQAQARLGEFLSRGYHGDMGWMLAKAERRRDPRTLWPEARSVVVVGSNYGPCEDPLALLKRGERGSVSVYARNRDYHDLMKKKLKALARWMVAELVADVKVFVDTAPVMEKHLAERAGLGWQGKHSNLVSREYGSWLFLGEVLTTLELEPDHAESDHCGACRRCLEVCPTAAFPEPYLLDARRCISYLTIEHKGTIARDLRPAMGNRIFGCDDCLAVCPWNKFARPAREAGYLPRLELTAPRLADLAQLDDRAFRQVFAGSPIKRIGRDRFLRNVLIAIGNSREPGLARSAEGLLSDPVPLVRAMAVWALSRLLSGEAFAHLREHHEPGEEAAEVLEEWRESAYSSSSPPG
jgi:epoxyqueuosine reductase